jgi:hypothetical protein
MSTDTPELRLTNAERMEIRREGDWRWEAIWLNAVLIEREDREEKDRE